MGERMNIIVVDETKEKKNAVVYYSQWALPFGTMNTMLHIRRDILKCKCIPVVHRFAYPSLPEWEVDATIENYKLEEGQYEMDLYEWCSNHGWGIVRIKDDSTISLELYEAEWENGRYNYYRVTAEEYVKYEIPEDSSYMEKCISTIAEFNKFQ